MEKALLGLSSIFLVTIAILGFKLNDDNKKIAQMLGNLEAASANNNVSGAQDAISRTRENILSNAANSPAKDIAQNIITNTVIPGKVIKQTVPVASNSKTSSSASKTTKTS
ncbi:MAG: hypothetical protein Q8M12_05280 [bacterium]|nr:hypothetical protein [bacterium]